MKKLTKKIGMPILATGLALSLLGRGVDATSNYTASNRGFESAIFGHTLKVYSNTACFVHPVYGICLKSIENEPGRYLIEKDIRFNYSEEGKVIEQFILKKGRYEVPLDDMWHGLAKPYKKACKLDKIQWNVDRMWSLDRWFTTQEEREMLHEYGKHEFDDVKPENLENADGEVIFLPVLLPEKIKCQPWPSMEDGLLIPVKCNAERN